MSTRSGQSPELDGMLGALREGSITPEQAKRLEALLATDAAARTYYIQYMELCSTLHYYVGTSGPERRHQPDGVPPPPVSEGGARAKASRGTRLFRVGRPTKHLAWIGLFAAAALIAATVLALGFNTRFGTRSAREYAPQDTRFTHRVREQELAFVLELDAVRGQQGTSGRELKEGATLTAGPIQLQSGRATLGFLSGVLLTIEGPARVELESMERVYCHYGKVRVRVPTGAEGFVIAAPGSAYADQGTEFALNVKEDGRARVKVIDGATEAALLGSTGNPDHCWIVYQNQVFELDPATGRIVETPPDAESFASIPAFNVPSLVLDPLYTEAVAASKPKGYWRFESKDGNAVPNEIAGGPALKTTGAVAIMSARWGTRAAEFRPGNDDQFLFLDDLWLPASEPGHAIEFWFLSRTIDYGSLVALYEPTQPGHFKHLLLVELTAGGRKALLHKPASVRFLHRWPPAEVGGQNVYSANHYIPNRWYHVVAQKNGERMELYLDGALSDSTVLDAAHATAACRLVVGRVGTSSSRGDVESRAFVGRIDELAIYDRPLSTAEIRRHHDLARQLSVDRAFP